MKLFLIFLCLPLINGVSVSKSEVDKQATSKRDAEIATTLAENTTTVDKGKDYKEKEEENNLDEKNEEADENRLLEPVQLGKQYSGFEENSKALRHFGRHSKQSRRNKREYYGGTRGGYSRGSERYNRNRRYGDNNDRHRDYHEHRDRGGKTDKKYTRLWSSELTGPNGVKVNITDPPYSKQWNCPGSSNSAPAATLIWLKPDGRKGKIEYGQVKDFVEKSWTGSFGGSIQKVEKITNQCLWKRYRYRKTQMLSNVGLTNVTETLLFYGAPAADLTTKTNEGFDERDLTLQSSVYGASFDFTSSSSKAAAKTTANAAGSKTMLLCRVALGNAQTVTAATKLAHAPVGFTSIKQGDEYAIYRGEEVYPEYLITYT